MFKVKVSKTYDWDLEYVDKDDVVINEDIEDVIQEGLENINQMGNEEFTEAYLPEELFGKVDLFEVLVNGATIYVELKTTFDLETYCNENGYMIDEMFTSTLNDIMSDCDLREVSYEGIGSEDYWDYDTDSPADREVDISGDTYVTIDLDPQVFVEIKKGE